MIRASSAVAGLALLLLLAAPGHAQVIEFRGTCDGSGAIILPDGNIATVDDEKEVHIRTWTHGGERRASISIPGITDRDQEPDFEGGTVMGRHSLWISSHGRDSRGRFRPDRQELVAIPLAALASGQVDPGAIRRDQGLRDVLRNWAGRHGLALRDAFGSTEEVNRDLAPENGGANIEAIAYLPDRREVWIGFRSPLIGRNAFVAPMENAAAWLEGREAEFGNPIQLDLGGRGLRDMAWSDFHQALLIVAGPVGDAGDFALYAWRDGQLSSVPWPSPLPADFHPEAILAVPGTDRILILSDDGDRPASTDPGQCQSGDFANGACTCKNIRRSLAAQLRLFRGVGMTLPR